MRCIVFELTLNSLLIRPKHFLRENPISIPILLFQILLLVCGVLMASGFSPYAELVAAGAYFLLVVFIVFQLAQFVGGGSKSE